MVGCVSVRVKPQTPQKRHTHVHCVREILMSSPQFLYERVTVPRVIACDSPLPIDDSIWQGTVSHGFPTLSKSTLATGTS